MTNWIFQLNPDRFDVAASEEADRPRRFNVARYREQLRPGDNAAIWVSGPHAGVYGLAAIAANEAGEADIYERVIEPNSGWRREEDIGQRIMTVNFRDDARWLDKPILRSILKADPRFEDAPILINPRQANPFLLTEEQWRAITSRLSDEWPNNRIVNAYRATDEFEDLAIPGVYAYSLPWIIKNPDEHGNILIKVGRAERVLDRFVAQARATEAPEKMVLPAVWATDQPMETERTFHNLLAKAGHPRSTGGHEWFVTNLDYLKAIGEALALKRAFINDEIEDIDLGET